MDNYSLSTPGEGEHLPPPSGIVTFLFTDIEESVSLWDRFPEGMHQSIPIHHAILYGAAAENQGDVVKTVGDAFQIAFILPDQALQAALAAQRALREVKWGETGPLKVRIGIHIGQVVRIP